MTLDCTAYRCSLCGSELNYEPSRCHHCNNPEFIIVNLTPQDYCSKFGHDGGTIRLAQSERFERSGTRKYFTGLSTNGGERFATVACHIYSSEYLFRCARCGGEKRERREHLKEGEIGQICG